jgi:hypothetical protein
MHLIDILSTQYGIDDRTNVLSYNGLFGTFSLKNSYFHIFLKFFYLPRCKDTKYSTRFEYKVTFILHTILELIDIQ